MTPIEVDAYKEKMMHKRFDDTKPAAQRASLVALMSILLFAAAADGLMEALGPGGFLVVGMLVIGLAWVLVGRS